MDFNWSPVFDFRGHFFPWCLPLVIDDGAVNNRGDVSLTTRWSGKCKVLPEMGILKNNGRIVMLMRCDNTATPPSTYISQNICIMSQFLNRVPVWKSQNVAFCSCIFFNIQWRAGHVHYCYVEFECNFHMSTFSVSKWKVRVSTPLFTSHIGIWYFSLG